MKDRFLKWGQQYFIEILIGFFSWALFLVGIHWKHRFGYDERHYVPTAQNFLNLSGMRNLEHPPLAKEIMALGLAIFGDNPYGWRFTGTLAGTATVVGMMFWGHHLFRDRTKTIQIGILTTFCCITFVQARSAMLDTYMVAFLVWTCGFFTKYLKSTTVPELKKNLFMTSIFLGLTAASKWFGLVLATALIGFILFFYYLRNLDISRLILSPKEKTSLALYPFLKTILLLLVPATTIYFITFIPYLFFEDGKKHVYELFTMQGDMYRHLSAVKKPHQYESHWTLWPLMRKPVCYFYQPTSLGKIKYVFSLVNPIIQWGGLVAIVASFFNQFKKKTLNGLILLAFYSAFVFCWIFLARRLAFFYYYYPAAMVLIMAIIHSTLKNKKLMWIVTISCVVMFIIYYPIISAIPFPRSWLKYWLWFRL